MQVTESSDQQLSWQFTDHACQFCFGRVLQRVVKDAVVEVRCAECSKSALGGTEELCCCGADCGALGKALECFLNPNITKENPQEIMVRERLVTEEEQTRPPSKPAHINQY